jgi:hypothetical protein
MTAKDFEAPTDANTDNVYVVQVTATSVAYAPATTNQTINVTVLNVADTLPAPGTPVLVWTSDTVTTPPVFSVTVPTDADMVAGDTAHFQRSTVSDFSTGVTDYTHTITSPEDAANAITFSSGTWANGTWYVRERTERVGSDNSAWSNTEFKTLAATGTTLKTGLVSWWSFDSTSWSDSHGSNTLTANGSPTSTTGLKGNAFNVNAGANYLTCASNSTLQVGGTDFSIAVWVHRGDTSFDRDIINKRTGSAGGEEYVIYVRAIADSLKVNFEISDSISSHTLVSTTGISNDGWHLVICTHAVATGVMTVSVDAGTRDTFTASAVTIPTVTGPLTIGNGPNNGWYDTLDELGFWKKVLTTTEETALYNSGAGLAYTDL